MSSKIKFSYAGFWRRALALFIDSFIFMFVFSIYCGVFGFLIYNSFESILAFLIGIPFVLSLFVVHPLYYAMFESSKYQGTPGKIALSLKVTDMDGKPIGFGRSFGRNICKYLSGLFFFVGYIMAGLTEKKQALHDKLMDCLVIRDVS